VVCDLKFVDASSEPVCTVRGEVKSCSLHRFAHLQDPVVAPLEQEGLRPFLSKVHLDLCSDVVSMQHAGHVG